MTKNKKNKLQRYIDSLHDIKDKTVIITGANSGLGFEIAKIALVKGARVVMACRNAERAEKAKKLLIHETGSNNVTIELYDQANIASIHDFSKRIKKDYGNFYALVLNAGVFLPKEEVDEFHISTTYKTNFIGALTLLLDLQELITSSNSERRIIIQGSLSSFFKKYKNKDRLIYGEEKLFNQYSLSKLCISNLYTYFRDDNENPYVKYLLSEPGISTTNIFQNFKKWFKSFSYPFICLMGNKAEIGCLSACKLLCDICANGDYYHPRHFFHAKGYPIKDVFPKKFIFENIITDGKKIIKTYE